MRIRRSVVAVFIATCILGSADLYEHLRLFANEPDEQGFHNVSVAWQKAVLTQDVHGMTDLSLRTARFHPITNPFAVNSSQSIWLASANLLSNPGFTLAVAPPTEIRSDDRRYDISAFEASLRDGDGKVNTWRGEHFTLWKRQSDGKWKVSVDVFSVATTGLSKWYIPPGESSR